MAELLDNELEQVSGGAGAKKPFQIKLTGSYWVDSWKSGSPCTKAIGWTGLTAEYAVDAPAPYRIYHNGTAIGWTVRSHFDRIGE